MSQVIKIRIASKTDNALYIKMLKNIKIDETKQIIGVNMFKMFYDDKTKMLAYDDSLDDKITFAELKVVTVEDFYYNCKTDYSIYFFDDEDKIKELYLKWFNKTFLNTVISFNKVVVYGEIISELKAHLSKIKVA